MNEYSNNVKDWFSLYNIGRIIMAQPTARSVLLMMLLISAICVPGLIVSILMIIADPSYLYNYIYLTVCIMILLILAGYAFRIFGPAKPRVAVGLSDEWWFFRISKPKYAIDSK